MTTPSDEEPVESTPETVISGSTSETVINLDPLTGGFTTLRDIDETGSSIPLRQEKIRGWLAIAFAAIFAAVLAAPVYFISNWTEAQEWLQAALPAVTGLVGSAMGFYFGQRNN